jgi:hypothetical protein
MRVCVCVCVCAPVRVAEGALGRGGAGDACATAPSARDTSHTRSAAARQPLDRSSWGSDKKKNSILLSLLALLAQQPLANL